MKNRGRYLRVATLCCGVTMLAGCYTYASTGLAEVRVGGTVRAKVTEAAADRTEPTLGYRSTTLDGKVVARPSPGSVLLRVPAQVFANGAVTRRYAQRVDLNAADILELDTRRLDRLRTGGLIAVGTAVIIYMVTRALSGNSGGTLGVTGGGPSPAIVFGGS